MKTVKTNTVTTNSAVLAAVLSLSAYTGLASAHCYDGLSLAANSGTNPVAADLYRVQCYTAAAIGDGGAESTLPTNKLVAVTNLKSGNAVTVQIGREGFGSSTKYTDSTANAAGVWSAACTAPGVPTNYASWSTSANGNGDYNLLVTKSSTAATNYGLAFHCQTSTAQGNLHTGTREVHAGSAAPELAGNVAISPDIDVLIDN